MEHQFHQCQIVLSINVWPRSDPICGKPGLLIRRPYNKVKVKVKVKLGNRVVEWKDVVEVFLRKE